MISPRAEAKFREGCKALNAGAALDALGLFKTAIDMEKFDLPAVEGQARYLSYYGLCLRLTAQGAQEAIACCRQATEREGWRSDLWWNLGRVALTVGHRGEAYRAFQRGLRLQPGHPGLGEDLRRMGVRRPPALSFLARGNPVNVVLGRLLAGLAGPRSGHHAASVIHAR